MKYTAIIYSTEEFITSNGYRFTGRPAWQSDDLDDLLEQVDHYSSFGGGYVWYNGELYGILRREKDDDGFYKTGSYPIEFREEEEDAEYLIKSYNNLVERGIEPALEMN